MSLLCRTEKGSDVLSLAALLGMSPLDRGYDESVKRLTVSVKILYYTLT